MVKVSDVVVFSAMVAGLKALAIEGGATTVMEAEAVPPAPPSVALTVPVVLFWSPAVIPVTLTENVHPLLAARVAPDKLMLFAMLIPIFWITRHPTILVDYRIPWWGSVPVWVLLILVGRELLITAFRFFAKRKGVVIPAAGAGKLKTVVQNVFIGATIAWFAWKDALATHRWAGWFRNFWDNFHGWLVTITLAGAVLLTIYSLGVYLYRYRALLKSDG